MGDYVVPTYLLAFDDEEQARRFVYRLHLALPHDVASFRDGCEVLVYDGTDRGARERVMQLARSSSASMVRVKQP